MKQSPTGNIGAGESTLVWAVICSVLLHILLAVYLPNFKFDDVKQPDTLKVELVAKPEPPAPIQPPEPEIAEPEPIKPKIEPKPVIKPLPTTKLVKEVPVDNPPPPSPPTEVIAVAPKQDAPPSPVPPAPVVAPEPPKPVTPQVDIDSARDGYGNTLWGAISKHKKYPKIAQMRGWQGEVIVELLLDGSGKLQTKKIIQSSGYESLDKQALEMIDKAAPFPAPPEALRSSNFTIKVPIPFKLEEQ